jgi:hypothetical protein
VDKRQKTALILVAVAVAAYIGYKWWTNRQSSSGQLGANLNSVAPALIAGSTGPQSGLNYYAGATNIYVTEQLTQSAAKSSSSTSPPSHVFIPPPHWIKGR